MAKAKKDIKTAVKRRKIDPSIGVATQFSKDKQPSPKAKSRGKKKAMLLKDLANMVVNGEAKEKALKTARAVGLDFEQITIQIAMTLRQIEKALAKGDTQAYNAAMDRLVGKAPQHTTQEVDHRGHLDVKNITFK